MRASQPCMATSKEWSSMRSAWNIFRCLSALGITRRCAQLDLSSGRLQAVNTRGDTLHQGIQQVIIASGVQMRHMFHTCRLMYGSTNLHKVAGGITKCMREWRVVHTHEHVDSIRTAWSLGMLWGSSCICGCLRCMHPQYARHRGEVGRHAPNV